MSLFQKELSSVTHLAGEVTVAQCNIEPHIIVVNSRPKAAILMSDDVGAEYVQIAVGADTSLFKPLTISATKYIDFVVANPRAAGMCKKIILQYLPDVDIDIAKNNIVVGIVAALTDESAQLSGVASIGEKGPLDVALLPEPDSALLARMRSVDNEHYSYYSTTLSYDHVQRQGKSFYLELMSLQNSTKAEDSPAFMWSLVRGGSMIPFDGLYI